MNKLLLGSVALAAFAWSGAVFAGDLPVRAPAKVMTAAPYSWTGIYIGANSGCGWSRQGIESFNVGDSVFPHGFTGDFDGHGKGCFVGGQIGANYQFTNNLVLGIEADGDLSWIKNIGSIVEENSEVAVYNSSLKSFGTVRGRLGWAFDRWLPYVTGGWAWGKNRVSVLGDHNTATSDTVTHSGSVWGAGFEYAVNNNWSIGLEYLRLDLGSKNYALVFDDDGSVAPAASINLKVQTVRVRANYKFIGAQ